VVSVAGEMSNTFPLTIVPAMPVILAVVGADGSVVSESDPAVPGEMLILYMTGLGAVDADLAFGALSPITPLALTAVTPQVSLGDGAATVLFSGLTPGYLGLYQVTIQLPATLPATGLANLTVQAGSMATSASIPLASQ